MNFNLLKEGKEMIKRKMLVVTLGVMMLGLLSGCGKDKESSTTEAVTTEATTEVATTEATTAEVASTEEQIEEAETSEANTDISQSDDIYVGEYLDYDYNEPELRISANGDGTYDVHIGIIRLAVFEDNRAVVTDAGLEFRAEDGAGNPILGVITIEGEEAVVTFTESTWSLISSGTSYRYHK